MSSTSIYCSCIKCKSTISTANISKHFNSKKCNSGGKQPTERLLTCPHCGIPTHDMLPTASANHIRWCSLNPKREEYNKDCSQMNTEEALKKKSQNIKNAHANGKYKDSKEKAYKTKIDRGTLYPTEATKKRISESARKSNHQRKCKKSHKFTDKNGRSFIFDSSWEDALAVRLDQLDILWDRPDPIPWVDSAGNNRKYFPDFYLPKYNLFLDPKNPYVVLQQKEKIQILSRMINLQIICSLSDCKNWCPLEESNLMPSTQL